MDAEEARTIGWALWRVRDARGKSLRVVAGLAGMSKDTLNRIERGLLSPTLNQILALAEALQISVSELTRLPVPAPANGHTDSTTKAIGLALDAIEVGHPGGLVLPVAVLRERLARFLQHKRACRFPEVAAELPGLVRDVHTTLAAGADRGELLDLAVYVHVHLVRNWLILAAAPDDLRRRVVFLARRLAQERDEVTTLGVAGFGVAETLLQGGAFELGKIELDSLSLPPVTVATASLVGLLATSHATAAVLDDRPGDAVAAMDAAADMADRFGELGEADPLGFEFGPTSVGFRRVRLALEAGEPDRAVSIAEGLHPERNPFPTNRAFHWVGYGRALAQLRGRRDDAVRALRRAETMNPVRVRRDPFVRDTIAVLLPGARRDAVGQELRDMASRIGLG
ncbi:MAG TPA: helix-turn-helix transcriptional regulator [Pseudonocardiaceae bacterium]|nr:helix-turn-helix transcriptional regulator [Pseudonocardiaceae bacterium]